MINFIQFDNLSLTIYAINVSSNHENSLVLIDVNSTYDLTPDPFCSLNIFKKLILFDIYSTNNSTIGYLMTTSNTESTLYTLQLSRQCMYNNFF